MFYIYIYISMDLIRHRIATNISPHESHKNTFTRTYIPRRFARTAEAV